MIKSTDVQLFRARFVDVGDYLYAIISVISSLASSTVLCSTRGNERRTISFYPTFSFVLSMDSASTTTVLERWKCDDTQQWRAIICPVVRDEREFLRFGTQVQLVLFRMAIGWWLHRYRDIYHRSELNNMIPRAIVCGKCGE